MSAGRLRVSSAARRLWVRGIPFGNHHRRLRPPRRGLDPGSPASSGGSAAPRRDRRRAGHHQQPLGLGRHRGMLSRHGGRRHDGADARRGEAPIFGLMTVPNFVGGSWTRASSAESLPVTDPATGEPLGRVPLSTRDDVGAAVAAAVAAFPGWRAVPVVERIEVLFRLRALLEQHQDELAETMTREHGKTRDESAGELKRGIESLTHACATPTLMMGETLEAIAPGVDCETIRQPLGVFAVVTPYNFPVMIPLWFWPFAVATGNTVVLKPSERDPLTHQRVVELAAQAGLPPGVPNVVHGDQSAVQALLQHPDVKGVSFVGSSQVAKSLYAAAAAAGKRVQALGGAKNHMIVLPDADFDATAKAVIGSVYGATGQRCLAGSVVVGVGEAYRPIRERVLDGAASLTLGSGLEPGVTMGPVISAPHRERVAGYVAQGERGG